MGNLEALVNNLKRTAIISTISLATLLGVPNKSEAPVFAQETKKELNVAAENKEELYKWIVNEHTKFFNQYADAKDKEKAQSQYEIVKSFDTKKAEDLVKTIEKIQGKVNTKKVEKINKEYETFKTNEIEKIYNTGAEKLKTDKNQAEEIFFNILKIDRSSTKFDEALEKELNWKKIKEIHNWVETTYLLPPEIAGAREKGMKYLAEASEGEKSEIKDELPDLLNLENGQIYRRKSKNIVVRSTLDETSAESTHKVSEGTIRLILEYLELSGKPPFNIRDEKTTESYPLYKITLLGSKAEQEKYGKDLETRGGTTIGGGLEKWTSKNDDKIYGFGHWMWIQGSGKYLKEYNDDRSSNLTLESVLHQSSDYFDSEVLRESPWLSRFFIYNFTWQILGTTYSGRILERDDKYDGKIEKISGVKSPIQLRAGAYFLADRNILMSINMLSRLKFDQFTDQAKATAFAATEYLIHNHKDKLVELLTDEYNKKTNLKDISKYEIVEKHFGLTPEQFDKNVQNFVKKNYVGYRNFKE